MPDGFNDSVYTWGIANGYDATDPALNALKAPYTPEEIRVYAGANDWNQGIINLANAVVSTSKLLMEDGFSLLLEDGSFLLLEA